MLRAAHRLTGAAANLALERVRQSSLALEAHVRERGVAASAELAESLHTDLDTLSRALRSTPAA